MDVKIGSITWDQDASQEKIETEKTKFLYGLNLGFRILGFRSRDKQGTLHVLDKTEAKLLTPEDIPLKLALFLSPDASEEDSNRRRSRFVEKLQSIRDFMMKQKQFRFISSSLLFAFDLQTDWIEEKIHVKMIDFAHTHCYDGIDCNYLEGLNSFIMYFSMSKNQSVNT